MDLSLDSFPSYKAEKLIFKKRRNGINKIRDLFKVKLYAIRSETKKKREKKEKKKREGKKRERIKKRKKRERERARL